MKNPNWTVLTTIGGEFPSYVKRFFDKEEDAEEMYKFLSQANCFPTKRPYHHETDQAWIDKSQMKGK